MKLFVEMTDKEYQEYKDFLDGNHVSQESFSSMKLDDFLKLNKFVKGQSDILPSYFEGQSRRVTEYKKDNIVVLVKESYM